MAVAVAMSAQWQEAANSGRVGSEGLVGVDVRPKTMVGSAQSSSQATKRPDYQNCSWEAESTAEWTGGLSGGVWGGGAPTAMPPRGQILETVVGKQSRQQAKVSAQERPAATKKAHKMVQELQSVKGQNSVG